MAYPCAGGQRHRKRHRRAPTSSTCPGAVGHSTKKRACRQKRESQEAVKILEECRRAEAEADKWLRLLQEEAVELIVNDEDVAAADKQREILLASNIAITDVDAATVDATAEQRPAAPASAPSTTQPQDVNHYQLAVDRIEECRRAEKQATAKFNELLLIAQKTWGTSLPRGSEEK